MSKGMTLRFFVALASLSAVVGVRSSHVIDPNAEPELQVGTGDDEFEAPGRWVSVPLNFDPQGGEHIWFAARFRDLGWAGRADVQHRRRAGQRRQ